uniref:Uncharacterized protein n=1 Tax=Amphimedon queenslandica TaxID=400682 RepID=A0A1X7TRA3_AMPQE
MDSGKQYFLNIEEEEEGRFARVSNWLDQQVEAGKIELKGHCRIKSDEIKKCELPQTWDREYDFSRTAGAVLRLALLKIRRFVVAVEINADNLLASDEEEAKEVCDNHQKLFSRKYFISILSAEPPNKFVKKRNVDREMIVVNYPYGVVWRIKTALQIQTDTQKILQGIPCVIVKRYNSRTKGEPKLIDYPYPPPSPAPMSEKDKKEFDEFIESFEKMGKSSKN